MVAAKEACLELAHSLGPRTYLFPTPPLARALRALVPDMAALELALLEQRLAAALAADSNQPMMVRELTPFFPSPPLPPLPPLSQ